MNSLLVQYIYKYLFQSSSNSCSKETPHKLEYEKAPTSVSLLGRPTCIASSVKITSKLDTQYIYTVNPALRGHHWDREKWALWDRWPLKRGSFHVKCSITGQEKGYLLIQVTTWAVLTVHVYIYFQMCTSDYSLNMLNCEPINNPLGQFLHWWNYRLYYTMNYSDYKYTRKSISSIIITKILLRSSFYIHWYGIILN